MPRKEPKGLFLLLAVICVSMTAWCFASDGEESLLAKNIPELVKTKPYCVVDVLHLAYGDINNPITNDKILDVRIVPLGSAKGFAYFDGRLTWKLKFGLNRPEDLDNDPEENCWKIIGGMTEQEKLSEFDPLDEGGAAPGSSGTGDIDVKVFYQDYTGGVSTATFRAKVVLKKMIVEVDWIDGTERRRVSDNEIRSIGFKPEVGREFIDAFGQVGIEPVIKDTPEKGNRHNIIPLSEVLAGRRLKETLNLVELLPDGYGAWRKDIKVFNDGLSLVAKDLIAKGYMDYDASRPDVLYVVGAPRWAKLSGHEIEQTRGATALFEYNKRRYNVAFTFNLAIAESLAEVNKRQELVIPYEKATAHTALHECVAHCFPLRWRNTAASIADDPYWGAWRCNFVGHPRRNENHQYGKTYKTNVAVADSTLDAAYYTWMKAPRLNDFSNLIGNSVEDKCRDIVRDFVVECYPKRYGRGYSDSGSRLAGGGQSADALSNK